MNLRTTCDVTHFWGVVVELLEIPHNKMLINGR
jgi:hypothetical protein